MEIYHVLFVFLCWTVDVLMQWFARLVKSSSYTEFQLSETEQIFLWEGSNIDCNFYDADVRIFTGQNNIRPK